MQSAPTNETRATVWKRCRVIGIINTVLAIVLLVITIVSLVNFIAHPKEAEDAFKKDGHELPNVYLTYATIGFWIIIYCQLIYYNYGLLRGSTPNDGSVIKKWLLMHTSLLVACIILSILQIILDPKHLIEFAIAIGTVIVILIEVVVVYMFYKELTNSGVENQPATV